ncbi:AraC family transcriptional regulator [Clostridium hydrogeniformans]|uniref:AraC family transcriptional regulator n=1 Tax=Clostridium hydrogeniformans TaxID=349933 RepID=UPI000488DA89|nr:AraC family transcriptional regulator [Clostridium hydrogeniformans]
MDIDDVSSTNKRGYLNKDFQLFHLKDKLNQEFELHYHDFKKIIILISGKVSYLIEGKSYKLKPWDILLVNSYEVHKPIIDSSEPYERYVLWINSDFLTLNNKDGSDLLNCFSISSKEKLNLLRPNDTWINVFENLLMQIETNIKSKEDFSTILGNSLFIQFMVYINRLFVNKENSAPLKDIEFDKTIEEILSYINSNLNENLSIEILANKFFMSKYYLMHKFKKETGYTLHSYITQKRLIMAADLIKKGISISSVCEECGFCDYSTFVRSFKKLYGLSPKNFYKEYIK